MSLYGRQVWNIFRLNYFSYFRAFYKKERNHVSTSIQPFPPRIKFGSNSLLFGLLQSNYFNVAGERIHRNSVMLFKRLEQTTRLLRSAIGKTRCRIRATKIRKRKAEFDAHARNNLYANSDDKKCVLRAF